jgi:hypothetical protein
MPVMDAGPSRVEYETLVDGAGLIPPEYRNRGYEKLDFAPGEGGLGNTLTAGKESATTDATMDAFLAGVAAGADPKDMAKELRGGSATKPKRGRRPAAPDKQPDAESTPQGSEEEA